MAGIAGSFKLYGVGGKLFSAIKSFYEEASACVKISGETSEHFEIKVGLRQGCVKAVQYLYGWCYERNEEQSWGNWSKNVRCGKEVGAEFNLIC